MTEDEREELIYRLLDEFRQLIGAAFNDDMKFAFIAGARAALHAVHEQTTGEGDHDGA